MLWRVGQDPHGLCSLLRVQLPVSLGHPFPLLLPSSASVRGAGLPVVALGHLISGASRFVKSVHILEVCRTLNVYPFGVVVVRIPVGRLAWPQFSVL